MKTITMSVSHQYSASAERVFDAWLEPAKASMFLFAAPGGEMVRADIDPRVGGKFCFVDRRDGDDIEHIGEYLEIERPHRLVFSFGVPKFSPQMTTVTIVIEALETGCRLTLTHAGVLPEYEERNNQGWTMILGNLEKAL